MSKNDSSGRGRPPKDESERRTHSHRVYLNDEEKRELDQRADAAGLSAVEYMRKRALGKSIQAESDQRLRTELRRIGSDLGDLLALTSEGDPPEQEHISGRAQTVLSELEEILSRLK